jgi:hypothetical protein
MRSGEKVEVGSGKAISLPACVVKYQVSAKITSAWVWHTFRYWYLFRRE